MSKAFYVTPDHLKLIQRACVRWEDCEFGAPSIDCKRPYGNSSVYRDIAKILGIQSLGDDFSDSQRDYMRRIHEETETVLEILLGNLTVAVGLYELAAGQWKAKP
jgi:hypothetical protein